MTVKELRQLLKAHKQDEIIRLLPYYDEYNGVSCATLKIGDTDILNATSLTYYGTDYEENK